MSPLNDPHWNKINVPPPLPLVPKPEYKRELTGRHAIAMFIIMGIVIWFTVELVQFLR